MEITKKAEWGVKQTDGETERVIAGDEKNIEFWEKMTVKQLRQKYGWKQE